jgi:hypothetical protein
MLNAVVRSTAEPTVPTVTATDPYRLYAEQGGRVTICKPSRRGLNRAQTVRVKPTRVAKSRG